MYTKICIADKQMYQRALWAQRVRMCPQMIAKGTNPLDVARSQVIYRDTKRDMHSECTCLDGYKVIHERILY